MRSIVFELCAETLDACIAARDGGAHRIELCRELAVGGLTPPDRLVREAIARSGLPVHVLIRPHPGDFFYGEAAFGRMAEAIRRVRESGAAGVVLGVLMPDRTVDAVRTRALVELARPMQVTFHRAFDAVPCPLDALEAVVGAGCVRVLTSGGHPDVLAGARALGTLTRQAAGRIAVAAGGGLRPANAAEVARLSGAEHFHGSLRATPDGGGVTAADVRAMIALLRSA